MSLAEVMEVKKAMSPEQLAELAAFKPKLAAHGAVGATAVHGGGGEEAGVLAFLKKKIIYLGPQGFRKLSRGFSIKTIASSCFYSNFFLLVFVYQFFQGNAFSRVFRPFL